MIQTLSEPVVWITQFAILISLVFILREALSAKRGAILVKKELDERTVLFEAISRHLDANTVAIKDVHMQINSRMDQLLKETAKSSRQEGKIEGAADRLAAKDNADQITQAIVASRPEGAGDKQSAKDNADQITQAIVESRPADKP